METTALTFGAPHWLWALLVLPLMAGLFVWSHRRAQALVAKIVAVRLRDRLSGSVSPLRRILRASLLLASIALAIVAVAQPRYGFIEKETKQKGRDVIVAIDTSRSMLATDIAPTRLARAKLFTQDLVRLLQGDRIGLVAFAGSAFLQAPLTLDYNAVTNALEELDTSVIPKGGTNIAAAITAAREAFGKAEGQTRALIILTDGEELAADGIASAKQAAGEGIRIFTVGIGSPEGSLIPVRLDDGRSDFVRDSAGKPVTSKLDDSRLKEIASATGGFFTIIGPDAAREIFQKGIEPMELSETGVFSARQPIERYQWPLAAATVCLALSLLPGDRRRRSSVMVALILGFCPYAQAQSGLDEYKNGEFEKAGTAFQEQLKKQPSSRALQFNSGAAAYKSGDFEKAIAHFTDALLAEDQKLREDASYNLANSLVRKGEAAKENEAKKTNWKNALEHYEETLRLNPDNKLASQNRDITKKLLEDLEKQEQQQKQQDQKNQDQKDQKDQKKDKQDKQDKQQQDQKDQQKQDQQKNEEKDSKNKENKDQQKQDSKDQKDDQQKQDEQKKDDQQKEKSDKSDKSDQSEQSKQPTSPDQQKQPTPAPSPTPGEKKEGELKSANEQKQPQPTPQTGQQPQPADAAEEEKEGQISPSQARALLNSLRGEEEKVNLIEQQQSSQDVLRDW
jgi:Ca-activated chloride channel family protein